MSKSFIDVIQDSPRRRNKNPLVSVGKYISSLQPNRKYWYSEIEFLFTCKKSDCTRVNT